MPSKRKKNTGRDREKPQTRRLRKRENLLSLLKLWSKRSKKLEEMLLLISIWILMICLIAFLSTKSLLKEPNKEKENGLTISSLVILPAWEDMINNLESPSSTRELEK